MAASDERFRVEFPPTGRHREARRGSRLMAIARRAGLPVHATCGGRGNCSHCLVEVLEGEDQLTDPEQKELDFRPVHGKPERFRMSCLTRALGPCSISHELWEEERYRLPSGS